VPAAALAIPHEIFFLRFEPVQRFWFAVRHKVSSQGQVRFEVLSQRGVNWTELNFGNPNAVRDLGNKVDRFAEEVRVSNVLRNRADREYLEERRRWYFSERLEHARSWNEDSERYSV
jgi:hypothetical protein